MLTKLKNMFSFESLQAEKIFIRLFSSWCTSSILFLFLAGRDFSKIGIFDQKFSILTFVAVFAAAFVVYSCIALCVKKRSFDDWCLPITYSVYCFFTFISEETQWYYNFVLIAFAAIMVYYYATKNKLTLKKPVSKKKTIVLISIFSAFFLLVVGGTGVIRFNTFSTPNFDFGIFCNMFYNMKNSFAPVTTCERDVLLSHFAVHLSPIYYVLLPLFMIFPSGATLQLSQAVILASAVAPVCLIAKKYGLSNLKTILIAAVCLFQPVVAMGTNYDFHENCFLYPLLLWVFYFFEKEKYIPMAIFAVLTLAVKEDAAIYLIFFALYAIMNRKKYLVGCLIALGAAIWFGGALLYLSSAGEGVMSGRYANFITKDGSLFDAVKNVLVNPAYAFSQIFINNKGEYGEKMLFILQLFVPLAFLPFATKKISQLILLLPMLLINLITVYSYQYDIGFQYSFGVAAFLIYLSIINLSELKPQTSRIMLSIATAASVMLFFAAPVERYLAYVSTNALGSEGYTAMKQALDEIPEDSSVICSTFLLPQLANREVIYEVHYHEVNEGEKIDYVILDMRYSYTEFLEKYQDLGYKITKTVSSNGMDYICILEPSN